MNNQQRLFAILVISALTAWLGSAFQVVELTPEAPHPPHVRATLERPEAHLNEELQRKAVDFADNIKYVSLIS
jgi:hypothetical protein